MPGSYNFLPPIFSSPKNYDEALKRLAVFMMLETWLFTLILRDIPKIDKILHFLESFRGIGEVLPANLAKANVGGFVIALLIAWSSRQFRLHDKISNLLSIRRRFDRNYILLPLAILVGVQLKPTELKIIGADPSILMKKVFYPYVSSRIDKPLVDRHEIERALDAWSLYWIAIEALPLIVLCAIVAGICGSYPLIGLFVLFFIVYGVAAVFLYRPLEECAWREILAIADDKAAKLAVWEAFRGL
jgi:hypothetical protein